MEEVPAWHPFAGRLLRLVRVGIMAAYSLTLLALLLGLAVGLTRTFLEMGLTLTESTTRLVLKELVTNVLTLVILLELVRAFIDYFEVARVKVEILLEVGVAFVLREMMLGMFNEAIRGWDVAVWATAVLALVGARSLAIAHAPTSKAVGE